MRRARRAWRTARVISATGVSGVRYRRQIELSTSLDGSEKAAALAALDETLGEVAAGRLADFRMVIRGRQRATHSDVGAVSGRARELQERGFYFLRYHPDGAKLGDVWDILPEDSQGRGLHFAPFPADLCRTPVLATCPAGRRGARPLLRHRHRHAGRLGARPPLGGHRPRGRVPRRRRARARTANGASGVRALETLRRAAAHAGAAAG